MQSSYFITFSILNMIMVIIKYETRDEWTIMFVVRKPQTLSLKLHFMHLKFNHSQFCYYIILMHFISMSFGGIDIFISIYIVHLNHHTLNTKRLKIRTNAQTWDVLFEIDTLDRQWKFKWAISCCYTFIVHTLMRRLTLMVIGLLISF